VIEEAHNIFPMDKRINELDVWVRLAREGSKFKIGMLYASQKVTGVLPQVLANTSNCLITHIDDPREISELNKYFHFEPFGDVIIRHEGKGYTRLRTKSSPYRTLVVIERHGFGKDNDTEAVNR
jgi:hypothetical protein